MRPDIQYLIAQAEMHKRRAILKQKKMDVLKMLCERMGNDGVVNIVPTLKVSG